VLADKVLPPLSPPERSAGPAASAIRAISLVVTTSASVNFNPLGQIHLTFGDIHLSPGSAGHLVTMPVKVICTWLPVEPSTANAQALVMGTVWTDQPYFRWLAGLEPQVVVIRGYPVSEELVFSVSDDELIAVERARGDGDVGIIVKLQTTLLSPPEGVHPVAQVDAQVRIPRARWLELLDQVGSEVGINLRVPSPLTDSADVPPPSISADSEASLSQAAARLRQARADLRNHSWEHCVATCRKALENVALLASVPSARSVFSIAAEQRTQDQRWAAIYHDVKSMASAAHHDDATTEDFVWSRADAEAILAATAGLLLRFTKAVH
jgi:hypothetical protein